MLKRAFLCLVWVCVCVYVYCWCGDWDEIRGAKFMCVGLSFEFVGGSNVCACGKAAHPAWSSSTRWPCQRKLWSEESANRAWCTSPETRIIGNWETTASSHPPANVGQELLFQFQPPDLPTPLAQLSFQSRACFPPARSWPTTPVTSGLLTLPLTSPLLNLPELQISNFSEELLLCQSHLQQTFIVLCTQ